MFDTPCRNCTDRTVGCHCSCERYIEWKNNIAKVKNNIAKERDLDYGVNGNFLKRRSNYLRKINKDK